MEQLFEHPSSRSFYFFSLFLLWLGLLLGMLGWRRASAGRPGSLVLCVGGPLLMLFHVRSLFTAPDFHAYSVAMNDLTLFAWVVTFLAPALAGAFACSSVLSFLRRRRIDAAVQVGFSVCTLLLVFGIGRTWPAEIVTYFFVALLVIVLQYRVDTAR